MELKWQLAHARGYLGLGMVEEASTELDQVPDALANETDVLALRAVVLQEQARWPALADIAGKLVLRRPAEAGWWIIWAYAARRSQSLASAEAILLNGEKAHPDEPTIQFNLGCYACQRGDLVEARRRVDKAIAIDPSFRKNAADDTDLEPLRAAGYDAGRE
jgi:tetratricopeptide (TPR) repeat protein